jgi:hypothetical protein
MGVSFPDAAFVHRKRTGKRLAAALVFLYQETWWRVKTG